MAKKKMSHNNHRQNENNLKTEIIENIPSNEDISNEKIERLKSLNTLLLKEASDRRHQVESLMEVKGSLESVLTRTNSEKDEIIFELRNLSEEALRLEVERLVVFDYVGLKVRECFEVVMRERGEFEVKLKEMSEVYREIKKAKSEKDREVKGLEEEVKVGRSLCEEMRGEVAEKSKENGELKGRLVEMEGELKAVKEELDCEVGENEEWRRDIEFLVKEKGEIEREANKVIEDLEGKIGFIEKEKEGVEVEMSLEKEKRVEMERMVSRLNETVLDLERVEGGLRMDVAELEKKCVEGEEKERVMAMEIDRLVGENEEMLKGLERVVEEKSLVEKNLDEALKRLDDQKKEMEIVGNEKVKVLEVLSGKESEIGELQKEVSEFKEVVKKLESSCNEGVEKIKNLESEVGRYKDALDRVIVERNEDRKVMDEEKKKSLELLQKIEDMAKIVEEKAKLIDEMKAENVGISDEKCEMENLCGKLRNDLASAESAVVEMRKEFDAFRSKGELEKESSKRVFDLLKGTAAKLGSSIDNEKIGTNVEKQLNGGGSEPYIAELDTIKNAFKRKEIKGEEMQRQIEVLKNSVAEEQKKKSFWTLLSSATSILATISLAYIARGR